MLDQMTQNVSATTFRGRLGFATRDETALATASTSVVGTLEDYGHEVDQFQARRAHRILLECDHYMIELRHRRSPSPMRQLNGTACRSELDVIFKPRFPEKTDEELTELLLARVLHRLLTQLDATTVEWLDTAVVLDRAAFLAVFAPEADDIAADIQIPVDRDGARPVGRRDPRRARPVLAFDSYAARMEIPLLQGEILDGDDAPHQRAEQNRAPVSPFAPVEETLGAITIECDRIIERRKTATPGQFSGAYQKMSGLIARPNWTANVVSAWALTAILAIFALPLGVTAAAVNLVRGGDIRFSVQMMGVLTLLMFLQSSELVHAALR
ncbi:hypothetical protein TRIHO_34160 [Tritonibacter horizontis]|uniref:Uncharacterized protein n=2 Tax=Tritonibacter horizontis TaxID=1768241 RepID=A0A132BTY7_9RHOB|nr:hypothetical protein TRIHO_34160 [Tritonibacter horizontis]